MLGPFIAVKNFMRIAIAAGLAVISLQFGCGPLGEGAGLLELKGSAPAPEPLTVVAQSPIEGVPADATIVELPARPGRLSLLNGRILVGTETGVFTESQASPGVLRAMPVMIEAAGPDSTGSIQLLTRRSTGVLVVGANGIFHDQGRMLMPSPLNDAFATRPRALHAVGEGAAEELWIITGELLHLKEGQLWYVRIPGLIDTPSAVVGIEPGRALVAAGGKLFEVNVDARTAAEVIADVGEVHDVDRSDDGAVWLASDSGLIVRTPEGRVIRHTFVEEGTTPVATFSVSAAQGAPVVTTAQGVVRLEPTGPVRVADLSGETTRSAVVDAQGDLWTLDGGGLRRWATGAAVSYEADVKPFLVQHCADCHSAGGNAPPINFENYDVVVSKAGVILARLQAEGAGIMPPASEGLLSPADYAVVVRWIAGGKQP